MSDATKTTTRCHQTFTKMANIKNADNTLHVTENVGQSQLSFAIGVSTKWYNHSEKGVKSFL